jgi:ABC-type multidrug transport system ATPase subunit
MGNSWKATVFLSSHDLPEVDEIATHIGFLNHGTLVAEDSKENLHNLIADATSGGVTIRVTGENLTKIVKFVEDKLKVQVTRASDGELVVTTKQRGELFNVLAEATRTAPDVKIADMVQVVDDLEAIFIRLAKISQGNEIRKRGGR